jgi:hypothetical protein
MAGNIPAVGGPGSYDQPVFLDCIIPYFSEKCNPLYEKNISSISKGTPPDNSICSNVEFYSKVFGVVLGF